MLSDPWCFVCAIVGFAWVGRWKMQIRQQISFFFFSVEFGILGAVICRLFEAAAGKVKWFAGLSRLLRSCQKLEVQVLVRIVDITCWATCGAECGKSASSFQLPTNSESTRLELELDLDLDPTRIDITTQTRLSMYCRRHYAVGLYKHDRPNLEQCFSTNERKRSARAAPQCFARTPRP